MSKVTFRSKQPYFQLSYMDVFRVGFITVPVVGGKPYKDNGKPNIDYAKCEELGIKDPDSVDSGYLFREGADHNEITLENEDVIEGIRAYIASRNDYLIVELEEGKLEIVKPVPQDLQPLVIELQGNYRKKQDPTDLSEYRRADRMDYRIQKGFITDIAHTERILHHELDNYAMDMSKELRVAMEEAERALKKAKDLLSKEAV